MLGSGTRSAGEWQWRQMRRGLFRLLVSLSVLWGTFSAAVVFAVRYDLLPAGEPELETAPRPLSLNEAKDWPVISAADWRQVITPESALVLARATMRRGDVAKYENISASGRIEWLDFRWSPEAQSAAWIVHTGLPACECPFESAERWDYFRVIIDPCSGALLGSSAHTAIASENLYSELGVRR